LLQLRAWPVPVHHDPVKASALAGPMIVALVLAHRSSSARAAPAALVAQDLVGQVPGDPVVVLVVPVVPAAPVVLVVGPELAAVVAVPVAAPLVRLAAVAARASPASRSGRSVKSLKCGRHQASAVSRFPVAMVPRLSGFARAPRSAISPRRLK
jgi:hypothetical protein